MVLDVDMVKRRISLGLKQCTANPWEDFETTHQAARYRGRNSQYHRIWHFHWPDRGN